MSNEQTRDTEDQRTRHHTEQHNTLLRGNAASAEHGAQLAQLSALMADPSKGGRSNSSTRTDALLAMQNTHGNRAVQRFIQRATPSYSRTVPVQRIFGLDSITDTLSDAYDWTKNKATSAGEWVGEKAGAAWDYLTKEKPKTFDDLATGDVTAKNAPDKITLPKEMEEGMNKAWEGSMPGGKSQEQGGILVKDSDGNYKWKAGKSLPLDKGGSGSFSVNRGDVGKGETLVGSGHTHPYDESEGGHTDVSFSGTDLANLIYNPENMKMVKSGEGEFVAAKTKEFTDKVKDLDEKGKKKMYSDMKSKYDETFKNTKGTFEEKNAAAAKAVSDEYGLAYYEGSGGELSRK